MVASAPGPVTASGVYAEVLLSLVACRERLKNVKGHYKETVLEALKVETAHERELLLMLERLASGAPPPASGSSVWDRVKKPEV